MEAVSCGRRESDWMIVCELRKKDGTEIGMGRNELIMGGDV